MSRTRLLLGWVLILCFIAGLMAVPACTASTPAPSPAPGPGLAPVQVPATTTVANSGLSPSITITAPAGNVPAGAVMVSLVVTGFTLVEELGKPSVPGQGHIHYFLDANPPVAPGKPAVTAAGTYYSSALTSYNWPNVTPGSHKFAAELVNNNHTPLEPPVVAEVTVTVTGAGK
jgi:hypothetical protein